MRISDWSSDVCSSDLQGAPEQLQQSGLRKLRRAAADAALALVDLLQQAQRDLVERFDRDGPAGQVLRQLAEGLLERDGVLDHALPVVGIDFCVRVPHLRETRPPVALRLEESRVGTEWGSTWSTWGSPTQ